MFDYQVKLTLTILGAVAFSLLMILLVFIAPIKKQPVTQYEDMNKKNMLEKISHAWKNKDQKEAK